MFTNKMIITKEFKEKLFLVGFFSKWPKNSNICYEKMILHIEVDKIKEWKSLWKISKNWKKKIYCSDTKGTSLWKNKKKIQKIVFIQTFLFYQLVSEFYMFLAFFWATIHKFCSKFQFFIFLAVKFPSLTNSIP